MSKTDYKAMRDCSNRFKENKDCAVIATAIVTRTSYEEAHALLKKFGRQNGRGTKFMSITQPAIESIGYTVTEVKNNKQQNGSYYTPKTIGQKLTKGYYLCRVKGHIFAVVNGEVLDWTKGRRHRIIAINQVTKKRALKALAQELPVQA
jgi:hypothetical protein